MEPVLLSSELRALGSRVAVTRRATHCCACAALVLSDVPLCDSHVKVLSRELELEPERQRGRETERQRDRMRQRRHVSNFRALFLQASPRAAPRFCRNK